MLFSSKIPLNAQTLIVAIITTVLTIVFGSQLPYQGKAIDVTNQEQEQEQEQVHISKQAGAEKNAYTVISISDGDTIKVLINDKTQTVRIANINTPETVDPRKPIECMGKQASKRMTALATDKKVFLETDKTQAETDRYGRLLRFVFLEDGTDIGLKMIEEGLAQSSPYGNSPHKYLERYETAQKIAQEQRIGLWDLNMCPIATPKSINTTIPKETLLGQVIKKSKSDICHVPGTEYYNQTTNYIAYNSVEECLQDGGRVSKK